MRFASDDAVQSIDRYRPGHAPSPAVSAGCGEKKQPESAKARRAASAWSPSTPREIQGGLAASGALMPREDTAIFPQINGYRVAEVLVDEGSTVKAGQPLARLDDTLLRAQLAQQEALANQQNVIADRAEAEAARVKGLDTKGILVAGADRRATVLGAFGPRPGCGPGSPRSTTCKTREALMTIRSPYDGLVIERNVRPGDMSAGTTPWFRIAKDSQVELAADVGEDALDKMRVGRAGAGDAGGRDQGARHGSAGQPPGGRDHQARPRQDQPAGAARRPGRRLRQRLIPRGHAIGSGGARDRGAL